LWWRLRTFNSLAFNVMVIGSVSSLLFNGNPLLRFDAFEARAGGIRTLLPHVDEFRTIHNLASMEGLVKALGGGGRVVDPKLWLKAG
jgi:uncharacterized protein with von Willebrand factor type A (vWA) domain